MQFKYLAFLFFLSISTNIYAQNNDSLMVESYEEDFQDWEEEYEISKVGLVEGSFTIYVPTGAFEDKIDESALYGFSFSYLKQFKLEKPAFWGVEVYHMHIGALSRTYAQSVSNEIIDIDGKMSSNAVGLNVLGRYYPAIKWGRIEPFLEGQFGVKWLHSYLSESGFFESGEEFSSFDFLEGSLTPSYGGAIGMQINVSDNWYLTIKSTYQSTVSSTYQNRILDEPNVFPLLPEDGFELVNSTTDNLKFDIGFTFLY